MRRLNLIRHLNCTLKLAETIQPLIVEAEKFTHFSGEEKKQYVLTKANQFAIDHKLKFDQEKVSVMIDELVETTKKVILCCSLAYAAQNFAYKIPIYWWVFPLAFLLISLITVATVTYQNWHAANENPVNSIKNE